MCSLSQGENDLSLSRVYRAAYYKDFFEAS